MAKKLSRIPVLKTTDFKLNPNKKNVLFRPALPKNTVCLSLDLRKSPSTYKSKAISKIPRYIDLNAKMKDTKGPFLSVSSKHTTRVFVDPVKRFTINNSEIRSKTSAQIFKSTIPIRNTPEERDKTAGKVLKESVIDGKLRIRKLIELRLKHGLNR